MNTEKRVVLITGANRGLGLETARQMKALGYRVILASRDSTKGESAARGLGVESFPLDVNNAKEIRALTEYVQNQIGRLDALVNNAAILIDEGKSLLELPADDLRSVLETNSLAPLLIARAFLPMMFAQKYGRIVNVSSSMGQYDAMRDNSPSYRLSKLLLNGITRILADAVKGRNVLVNAVDPGWVRTDMGGRNASRSLEQGAKGIVWAATLPDGGPRGGFFLDGKVAEW
jgi:NAD(P)-dependent dehydrogenase (short-subunit alcohol dehydrogenase family)